MSPTPETIRLAAPADKGACLYNSYHLMSQLAGLYAQAGALDHHELARAGWDEMSDGVLADLGDLYAAWDVVHRDAQSSAPSVQEQELCQIVARCCLRASRLIGLLSVWTPILKWSSVLQLCERRWQSVLTRLAALRPDLAIKLGVMRTGSLDRTSRLTGMMERYKSERAQLRLERPYSGDIVLDRTGS